MYEYNALSHISYYDKSLIICIYIGLLTVQRQAGIKLIHLAFITQL